MKTSMTRAKNVRSIAGKILLAVTLASAIGGLSTGPALGEDRGWRQEQQDRERDRHERDRRDNHRRRVYQPVYRAPIYAPPPVVYAPSPSPGISLFFPLFR